MKGSKGIRKLNQYSSVCESRCYEAYLLEGSKQGVFALCVLEHGQFANANAVESAKGRSILFGDILECEACLLNFGATERQIDPSRRQQGRNGEFVRLLHLRELLFGQIGATKLEKDLNHESMAR